MQPSAQQLIAQSLPDPLLPDRCTQLLTMAAHTTVPKQALCGSVASLPARCAQKAASRSVAVHAEPEEVLALPWAAPGVAGPRWGRSG